MKFSRLFILAAAVALMYGLSSGVANANTVDPQTGTGGSGSCFGPISFGSEGLSQTYSGLPTTSSTSTDPNGNCVIDFTNNSGVDLTSLTVTILTPFFGEGSLGMTNGSLSCQVYSGVFGFGSPSPFNNAVKTDNNACTFNDAVVLGSWLPDTKLGLQLGVNPTFLGFFKDPCSDPNGTSCANLDSLNVRFDATSATPEPGTMVLIGTGLVALVGRKKLKARQLV